MFMNESDDKPQLAAARATAYGLAAMALRFPDDDWVDALALVAPLGERLRPLLEADATIGHDLRALLAGLSAPDPGADALTEIRDQYAALFGHAVRGKCPPYELEYGAGEIVQRAPDLADIAGFYAAFGLAAADGAAERSDHASVEFEFMSVLCAKEAHGLEHGDAELVRSCREAQRAFLRDHLALWIPAFAGRLAAAAPEGVYGALANFLQRHLADECARADVPLGPKWLDLCPVREDADAVFECGVEESAPGARDRIVQVTVGGQAAAPA